MARINPINEMLHRIRVKLYPNYLPHVAGGCIARKDNEASLSIEEVCGALKNRGGFTGNYHDLVEYVKQFFDEAAYQRCDGFAVNTEYFSIHPNLGGTFDKLTEGHDTQKHPVSFRFRTLTPLRSLAEHSVVEVEGLAQVNGYIDEVVDVNTEAVNETLSPGGPFSIAGHKIKVAGADPEVGVYFVSQADPSLQVKVSGHFAENTGSKVIGLIPALSAGTWKAAIKTQYTGSGSTMLKSPRVIRVVQKPQFLNNFRLKTAKCGAFCKTCSITNRVIEQVH
ncbi:MAG: DUF4469 domain-containing protein [Treponema sp.]|jgi:hypothetical protein|nr:DUF4469 domain-containing protein [Treponema sp.]